MEMCLENDKIVFDILSKIFCHVARNLFLGLLFAPFICNPHTVWDVCGKAHQESKFAGLFSHFRDK